MKFAFMTFSCPNSTWEETLALAKNHGYAGIEPRIDARQSHGIELNASPDVLRRKRDQARDAGVEIVCIAMSCRYANPADAAAMVDQTRHGIDLAATMGARRLRVFGGAVPDDISRNQAIDGVAAALRKVADHAAAKDVVVCMETHDDWCRPAHVAAVMKKVNHPAVAVNWDIMHPVTRGFSTMRDSFDTLRPWIRHVHIHDGQWQEGRIHFCPIGQGVVDHAAALGMLREVNYDGALSGEWIGWEPAEVHLPREIALLQRLAKV